MPNRKISHLRAKLEGGSVGETFDIYDESAHEILKSKYLFIGDSFQAMFNSTNNGWANICANYLGLPSDDYYILAVGGSGFAPSNSSNSKWKDMVANNSNIPDDITYIVVGGGTNDNGVAFATILSAAQEFDSYVKSRFSKLKTIYLSYMSVPYSSNNAFSISHDTCTDYARVAQSLGWVFTSGVETTMFDPSLINNTTLTDKVHPTETGTAILGRNLCQFLKSGYCKVSIPKSQYVTVNSSLGYSGQKVINTRVFNNSIRVWDNTVMTFSGSSSALTGFVTLYTFNTLSTVLPITIYTPVVVRHGSTQKFGEIVCSDLNTISLYLDGVSIPANTSFVLQPWNIEGTFR